MRYYGCWNGNPDGTPEDPKLCVAEVWPRGSYISRQCSRSRGDAFLCAAHRKDPNTVVPSEEEAPSVYLMTLRLTFRAKNEARAVEIAKRYANAVHEKTTMEVKKIR